MKFSKTIIIGIFILIVLILVAFLAYYLGSKKSQEQKEAKKTTTTRQTSPVPAVQKEAVNSSPTSGPDKLETISGSVMRFTSSTSGITFTFLKNAEGQTFTVLKNGNTICATYDPSDTNCSKGQSVEVFSKQPNQSLKDAVKEKILAGYSPNDCFPADYSKKNVGANQEFAQVSYPKTNDENDPFSESTAVKCPEKYRETNGIRYFMADKSTPDKFVFFNIGQYLIYADSNSNVWQDSLQFLK